MNKKIGQIRETAADCGVKIALAGFTAHELRDSRLCALLAEIQAKCHDVCAHIDGRLEAARAPEGSKP